MVVDCLAQASPVEASSKISGTALTPIGQYKLAQSEESTGLFLCELDFGPLIFEWPSN